jgi:radical SAM superfamily enzyme YgiQ (UPF0313 family)
MAPSVYIINPSTDYPSFYTLDALRAHGLRVQHYADLAVTTVSALAPRYFRVQVCDETVSPVDLETPAEFVALTGKAGQVYRMLALARAFRKRGKIILMGGPFASLNPSFLRPFCDILVRGEFESVAELLFADLAAGCWKDEYKGERPDLSNTPVPRWDLYPNDSALVASVQTSRGCPFSCEFCDVIVYLGRKQRHKQVTQVLRELAAVYERGYRSVFLADDNLMVYVQRAKELASAIARWNDSRRDGRVQLQAQVSLDSARDQELLALWARAGLTNTYIGIETPNEESLRETKKRQNLHVDLVSEISKFLSSGIGVLAGMIVGFDSDGLGIFARQYAFAMECPVPVFALNTLVAPPGTPFFERLEREGRIVFDSGRGFMLGRTNFAPSQMSADELAEGFRWLANRLYEPAAFEVRMLRFLDVFDPRQGENAERRRGLQVRVDREVLAGVTRLGRREADMVRRIQRRLESKPRARHVTHMYAVGGIWDPRLAAASAPFATAHSGGTQA